MTETSLWFADALLSEGWSRGVRLRLVGGQIVDMETAVTAESGEPRHDIGLPGLANLHSHAFQRAMAGLTETRGSDSDSFWSWRELMYRFVERLGPDDLEAVAALAFMEMLECGFTRVGEFHYLHHAPDGRPFANIGEMAERLAAAAGETGIGLTLLPVFYAQSGFGGAPPKAGQRRFINSTESYARLLEASRAAVRALPDGRVGVAPHSLRAVTEAQLQTITDQALGPIHIHIAEQMQEVSDCLAWSGSRPVDWLMDRFPIDARWCLVHATHLSPQEVLRLARSAAVAGLCPITEANLGDGVFPAPAFLQAGGLFGIGSDSNVRLDAAEELRILEYGQRLTGFGRNMLASGAGASTGADLFRSAVAGGARALGEPSAVGLARGSPADIVSLAGDHPDLVGRTGDRWIDSWVFAGGARAVDCVWRLGQKVVEHGQHHARSRIVARYRGVLEGLVQ